MRRTLLIGAVSVLSLAACTRHGDLQPAEVLRRASQAVEGLGSAHFAVRGSFAKGQSTNIAWNAEGVLANGGKQLAFAVDLDGTLKDDKPHVLKAHADITVTSPTDVYLRMQSLTVDPPHPMIKLEQVQPLLGKWFLLPSGNAANQQVTTDPSLLRAQSQVVQVTADHGLVRNDGHDDYSYTVAIDAQKLHAFLVASAQSRGEVFDEAKAQQVITLLSALKGEMLIDANTFFVDRFRWSAAGQGTDALSVSIDMTLTGQNSSVAVSPPPDAIPLDPAFLNGVPGLSASAAHSSSVSNGEFPLLP